MPNDLVRNGMTPEISVVIPVYNEVSNIPELHRRLFATLDHASVTAEVVYVDDGSTDRSLECLRQLADGDSRVSVVELSRNFGLHPAVMAGLNQARGKAVVIMDADLQDAPEILPSFLKKWREGYEVVYGIKTKRKENLVRRFLFSAFHQIQSYISNVPIPRDAGLFCLMDRRVVEELRQMLERNKYIPGLRAWVGFRQIGVECERDIRYAGKPRQTLARLIRLAMDGIISFSYLPLRLATYLGLVVAAGAFLVTGFVLYARLFTDKAILGWASITVSILFLGGIQLIMIGVLGEYIGRIYDEVKERPYYIVKSVYNCERQN